MVSEKSYLSDSEFFLSFENGEQHLVSVIRAHSIVILRVNMNNEFLRDGGHRDRSDQLDRDFSLDKILRVEKFEKFHLRLWVQVVDLASCDHEIPSLPPPSRIVLVESVRT